LPTLSVYSRLGRTGCSEASALAAWQECPQTQIGPGLRATIAGYPSIITDRAAIRLRLTRSCGPRHGRTRLQGGRAWILAPVARPPALFPTVRAGPVESGVTNSVELAECAARCRNITESRLVNQFQTHTEGSAVARSRRC